MRDDGERISRKRVERLMRLAGLSASPKRKWRATTIRMPGVRVADDLVDRKFAAGAPNRVWVADITYLRTWQGWLYLVAVQDLYSRRIVGWSMADHMRAELVTDALEMALAHRRPERGLIWHSDQGSQFVTLAFGQKARAAGIAQSMGSKGDCFDNAVAESFFATLKKELIHRRSWPIKAELRTEVFDYIEVFYNRERRHSTLGQRSPADYEKMHNDRIASRLTTPVHRSGGTPVVWVADFRAPALRLIWWVQTLDNENDGSQTSGPTTCIAVAPRFFVSSAFRTSQVRARLHSDASLRRGKTYATHRHACRGPRDHQIIRRPGALKSASQDDGFWPVEFESQAEAP